MGIKYKNRILLKIILEEFYVKRVEQKSVQNNKNKCLKDRGAI